MNDQELTSMKLDVLREIGNIGAGNATTALSVMLNSGLRVEVPVVKMLNFNEIPDMIGGPDTVVAAVLTHFTGEVSGMTLFVLEMEEAKNLAGTMLGRTYDENFTEFDYMDFPSEPLPNDGSISRLERLITYVVQDAGYYTEKVYPSDLAAVEIQNLRFMWNETLLNLKDISSINYATHQHLIKSIQKLKNGIENKEEVEREKEVVLVEIGLKRALKNYLKKIFVKDKDNGRI